MTGTRISTRAALLLICMTSVVVAQNPKHPTPTLGPPPIVDAVTLWVDGQNLTVYVDSTSNPDDGNRMSHLEIKWEGAGAGFVEANCDFENIFNGDFDICTNAKIAKISSRGFGPIYSLGEIIPNGYLTSWSPEDSWIVDGYPLDRYKLDSPYFGPIPEPSSLTLFCIGLILLRRRP